MTRTEIRELMRELKRYFIRVTVEDYRVRLSGGERHAREHYASLIASDADIEAQLILELSRRDPDLRYDIEERASIVWSDGHPYDELSAVKVKMEVSSANERAGQV